MSKSSNKLYVAALAAAASVTLYDSASAYNAFPYVEAMGNDADTYTPSDNNMFDDAGYGGLPPGFVSPNPSVDFQSDWDIRRFNNEPNTVSVPGARGGDIEEVASGFQGVATGDGSANFALHGFGDIGSHYGYRNGGFSRAARSFSEVGETFWATDDVYIDPNATGGGFWINAAVNGAGGYITETSWRVSASPAGWTISAAGAQSAVVATIPHVAGGQWTRWEAQPVDVNANGGLIGFNHRIFGKNAITGEYDVLLGQATVTDYLNGAIGTYADIVGPRWQWILSGSPAFPAHLYVDNTGWTNTSLSLAATQALDPVPEPATLGLLAAAGGMLAVRRRRR